MPTKEQLEQQNAQLDSEVWDRARSRKERRTEHKSQKKMEGRFAREEEATLQRKEADVALTKAKAKRLERDAGGSQLKIKGPKSSKAPGRSIAKARIHFPRLAKNPKRIVLAEFTMALLLVQGASLVQGEGIEAEQSLPVFAVYLVLFFAAELGDDPARIAAAFGLLVLLAVFLMHGATVFEALATFTGASLSPAPTELGRMRESDREPGSNRHKALTTTPPKGGGRGRQ